MLESDYNYFNPFASYDHVLTEMKNGCNSDATAFKGNPSATTVIPVNL